MRAFNLVETALRGWKRLPDAPPLEPDDLRLLKPICGFSVQLRMDGRIIGRGMRISLDRPSTPEIAYAYLVDAYSQAYKQADANLNLPNDALRNDNARLMAKRISISIDAAAAAVPIEPNTWEDVVADCNPGMTGYIVRVGAEGAPLAVFPSTLVAANTMPHRGLSGLVSEAIGEGGAAAALDDPKKIREERAIKMYRFYSTHLAQPSPEAPPSFMTRGAKLVMTSTFTLAEVRGFSRNAAENLMARLRAGDGFLVGTLRPWVDEQPEKATPSEHAMALLALERYSRIPGLTDEERQAVVAALMAGIARLRESGFSSPVEAVAQLVLAHSLPRGGMSPSAKANSIPDGRARLYLQACADGKSQPLPDAARGMVAYGLAVKTELPPSAEHRANAEAYIRKVFAEIPSDRLAAQMPWLGEAEVALANAKTENGGKPAEIPSAVALREVRNKIWSHQYTGLDAALGAQDLVGGIVFTTAGSTPLPTWQSARVLAFAAMAMRDERLTERAEVPLEVSRMLKGIRFLRQLQVDEYAQWRGPVSPLAMGGMRASPWDQSMPPDATSLSLITLSEALMSFDALDVDGAKRAARAASENTEKTGPSDVLKVPANP